MFLGKANLLCRNLNFYESLFGCCHRVTFLLLLVSSFIMSALIIKHYISFHGFNTSEDKKAAQRHRKIATCIMPRNSRQSPRASAIANHKSRAVVHTFGYQTYNISYEVLLLNFAKPEWTFVTCRYFFFFLLLSQPVCCAITRNFDKIPGTSASHLCTL